MCPYFVGVYIYIQFSGDDLNILLYVIQLHICPQNTISVVPEEWYDI